MRYILSLGFEEHIEAPSSSFPTPKPFKTSCPPGPGDVLCVYPGNYVRATAFTFRVSKNDRILGIFTTEDPELHGENGRKTELQPKLRETLCTPWSNFFQILLILRNLPGKKVNAGALHLCKYILTIV
jgi:hypothetical protein